MRPGAGCRDDRTQRALTTSFDIAAGGLTQNGDITAKPVGQLALDTAQTVGSRLDLFTVIEDQRDVMCGIIDGGGQVQEYRIAGFHIRSAATPDVVGIPARRHVISDRHGIEVAGQDHPGRPPEVSSRQDRVAVADHLVSGLFPQCAFNLIGDAALIARHTRDVDERGGQFDRVGTQVQHN